MSDAAAGEPAAGAPGAGAPGAGAPGAGAPAAGDPVRRSYEIEDPTNLYFIHPISARLVPIFARAGITPNQVSLLGMGCGLLAGLAYHFYGHASYAIAGFALMLGWHVMDGADGQLARLTRSYSELGKVLDGICDYVTFAAVYAGLGFALSARLGGWVWAVVALSGLCHAVQSASYELHRQDYNFWGWGRQATASPAALPAGRLWRRRIAAGLNRCYARMQRWAGGGGGFDAQFAALLAARPAQQAALLEAYRAYFAPVIRRWGVLCANYRTLGIFLAALLRLPLLYFGFEIVGFSVILVLLQRARQAQNAGFLDRLQREYGPGETPMPALQEPGA